MLFTFRLEALEPFKKSTNYYTKAWFISKPSSEPKVVYESTSEPSSGFTLFSRHLLSNETLKALKGSERDQQLSIRWDQLTKQEQSEYNVEAEKVN